MKRNLSHIKLLLAGLLLVFVACAAWHLGQADAKEIHKQGYAVLTTGDSSSQPGSSNPRNKKFDIHAIPTGNVASLQFPNSNGPLRSSRPDDVEVKFVKVNLRQNAADPSAASLGCSVYIGAIGSMHFLGQVDNHLEQGRNDANEGDSVDTDDQEGGGVSGDGDPADDGDREGTEDTSNAGTERGDHNGPPESVANPGGGGPNPPLEVPSSCKLRALVGPFATGKPINCDQEEATGCGNESTESVFDKKATIDECPSVAKGVTVLTQSKIHDDIRTITDQAESLVLVGRADKRPINNSEHGSNMELTEQRVNWVRKLLPREVEVLSIRGGPVDSSVRVVGSTEESVSAKEPGDDPCFRVVEVYTCDRGRTRTLDEAKLRQRQTDGTASARMNR